MNVRKINHIIHKRIVDERLRLGKKYSGPVYMGVGEGRRGNPLRWGNPPVHRLRRQILDLDDTDKSRYFPMTEFNYIVLSFYHQVCFLMNVFGKRSDLPFFTQERSQEEEKRGFVFA